MCILGDSPCRQNVRDFVRGNKIYKGREKVLAMSVYEVSPQHVRDSRDQLPDEGR